MTRAGTINVSKSGEQYETFSLSRAWKNAIGSAIEQVKEVCRDFRIIPAITRQGQTPGSPWISVDLGVHRVAAENIRTAPRRSLKQPAQDQARRSEYLARVRDNG